MGSNKVKKDWKSLPNKSWFRILTLPLRNMAKCYDKCLINEKQQYKENLSKLKQWYKEGKISKDMYKKSKKKLSTNPKIATNIYNSGPTLKEYVKEQNRVHKWFKYKLILPLLFIAEKMVGKWLVKEVPDLSQFKDLRLFNRCIDDALYQWCATFRTQKIDSNEKHEAEVKRLMNANAVKRIRLIAQLYMTLIKNDTSYLELHNTLMYNIALQFGIEYNGKVNHLCYNSKNITEINYFILKPLLDKIQADKVMTVTGEIKKEQTEQVKPDNVIKKKKNKKSKVGKK